MKTGADVSGSRGRGTAETSGEIAAPGELLRADLRELGPFPGEGGSRVGYRPGPEVRAELAAALHRAATELGADAGAFDRAGRLGRRRHVLGAAIARATGTPADEIVPFASLASLFAVLCSSFPRSRDRQPASVMLAAPGRSLYKWSARAAGVKVVEVPLDAGLRPDLATMTRALGTLRPSLILLGSPHDGTGIAPEPAALESLLRATAGDALVVLDESFAAPGWSRRSLRQQAPHLVLVRSFEPWLAPDVAASWAEMTPDLARALEVFPPVSCPELTAAQVGVAEALLTGDGGARERFGAEVDELHAVHERLRVKLAQIPGTRPLPARAPFVAVVHDEPVDVLLAEAARRGLCGLSGGGFGRLARLSRITVADDGEADQVVALVTDAARMTASAGGTS